MKGLALETITNLLILLVLALVVMSLIIYFSDSIKEYIRKTFSKEKIEAKIIEAKEFTTNDLRMYVRACWDRVRNIREDTICFILKGDFSKVDTNAISASLDFSAILDVSKFDKSKTTAIIRYDYLGKIIILES